MSCKGRRKRIAWAGLLLATVGCDTAAIRLARPPRQAELARRPVVDEPSIGEPVAPSAAVEMRAAAEPVSASGLADPLPPVEVALVSAVGDAAPVIARRAAGAAGRDGAKGERVPLPQERNLLPDPIGTRSAESAPAEPLPLAAVVESVYRAFPEVAEAAAAQAEARGNELAAWGPFDMVLNASTINQPLDFFENYRHAVALTQPLWSGGAVSAGYRIGRGNFEPWYEERNTDDGGELSLGFQAPLMQGRQMDPRRVAVRTAALRRQAADPEFQAAILGAERAAARAYWGWVQAGFAVEVQRQLLELGRERVRQIETQIAAGELGRISAIDNARLIALREAALIQAERDLQLAAVNLSIYLRDGEGMPVVAPLEWLPTEFPPLAAPHREALRDGVARAPLDRPEPRALQIEAAALRVELAGAANQILPQLDATVEASQDVGGRAKKIDDKDEFKLVAGLQGTLPVQRRTARGRIAALEGKLGQNRAQMQLIQDRIAAQAQEAATRLVAAWEQIERAEANQRLSEQALGLGRVAFEEGDIDLLLLNIYEQSVADAQLGVYSAKAAYFAAAADFQTAIGERLSPSAAGAAMAEDE